MDEPTRGRGPRRFPRSPAIVALLILCAPTILTRGQPAGASPDYWVIQTRACPQVMGTDPWPSLAAFQPDGRGRLARRDSKALLAIVAARPVVVLVHGSYYTAEVAADDGRRLRDHLALLGAVRPETVVVEFDWPSQLVYPNPVRDGNEKARRAFVAGYHLARFLQAFPPGARVCLIGHSHGGMATLSALHLLGGGVLGDGDRPVPPSALPEGGSRPRVRAVVIASGNDRHWHVPGERLGNALLACEGLLSLHNHRDPVLVSHPLGKHSEGRAALGRAGLDRPDQLRLGTLAARYRERDIAPLIGVAHNFVGSVSVPQVAGWIAPYARWPDAERSPTPARRPPAGSSMRSPD